jgi:hypothetical protein
VRHFGRRPKDGRQKLKLRSGTERRFKANEIIRISKRIVEKTVGANRGIGFEGLSGVRERARFREIEAGQDVETLVRRFERIDYSLSI